MYGGGGGLVGQVIASEHLLTETVNIRESLTLVARLSRVQVSNDHNSVHL